MVNNFYWSMETPVSESNNLRLDVLKCKSHLLPEGTDSVVDVFTNIF